MAEINVGDRVRVKEQKGWPSPPGYRFTNAEGTVVKWIEYDEPMEEFRDYVNVRLDKAEGEGKVYIGNDMCFRVKDMEKI